MSGCEIDPDYPRPMLVRAGWQDLCGTWEFAFGDVADATVAAWLSGAVHLPGSITVPFPPESELSGVADTAAHRSAYYRREFDIDRDSVDPEHRVLLHFGAVDYAADVWVNGVHVGGHAGGHTPFTFDITDALARHSRHAVVVRVEDPVDDVTQPRGKQDWRPEPHGVWYHRTTGIWQPVWLEVVPALHIEQLHWTPDIPGAAVGVEVTLSCVPARPVRLRVALRLGAELLAEQTMTAMRREDRWQVSIPALRHQLEQARLLWSPESPTLIDAELEVLVGDDVVDRVRSYIGLRSVGVQGGRFLLNGTPRFLRLVLAQNYWPSSHLAAPSPQALRREAELVRELGFNGLRVHQKIEDPRFLAHCDRLGLLVWGEMPSAYEFGPRMVERLTAEWLAAVRRDRSHPCIVTWVPFNESWGIWNSVDVAEQRNASAALYYLTKAVDPTRPVISNDGWEHTESDIWGLHDYAPDGESIRRRYDGPEAIARILGDRPPARRVALLGDTVRRGQPVMITEFGGLSYRPADGEEWHGYATVSTPEEFLERLRGLVDAVLDNPELAGFCYTQLTDTAQERNGLLTAERESKLPVAEVAAIVTRPARATPAEAIDAARAGARPGGTVSLSRQE